MNTRAYSLAVIISSITPQLASAGNILEIACHEVPNSNRLLITYDDSDNRTRLKQEGNLSPLHDELFLSVRNLRDDIDNVFHSRISTSFEKSNLLRANEVRLARNKPKTACDPNKKRFFIGNSLVGKNEYISDIRRLRNTSKIFLTSNRWGWSFKYSGSNYAITKKKADCLDTFDYVERGTVEQPYVDPPSKKPRIEELIAGFDAHDGQRYISGNSTSSN